MVNSNEPIGITIECEPDIGTIGEYRLLQALRVSRSTAFVDIGAIRVSVNDDDIGTDRSKTSPASSEAAPFAASITTRMPCSDRCSIALVMRSR